MVVLLYYGTAVVYCTASCCTWCVRRLVVVGWVVGSRIDLLVEWSGLVGVDGSVGVGCWC